MEENNPCFLKDLNDEFESIRIQILNSRNPTNIEEVYTQVETEEQRWYVIFRRDRDMRSKGRKNGRSALVSQANNFILSRKYTRCKKSDHTMDFCQDLHPKKNNMRGRESRNNVGKKIGAMAAKSSEMRVRHEEKKSNSGEQMGVKYLSSILFYF